MRYRIKFRVTVQHEMGGRCKTLNKYFRRQSIEDTHSAISKYLLKLEEGGYEIVETTTVGGWVK